MTKKRILLIDDEPSFTRGVKVYLEKTGAYEVREENRGRFGLDAARQFNPDLILLDVVMPDMSGGEVARHIETDRNMKNTPIVFLTAAAKKEDEGIICGRTIIAKPVDPDQVVACIKDHLGE